MSLTGACQSSPCWRHTWTRASRPLFHPLAPADIVFGFADEASAAQVQAKALIELNNSYSLLKLKMSSQDAAHELSLRVESGGLDETIALNELNLLSTKFDEEREIIHEKILNEGGSDLLKHWLTEQVEARREELEAIGKKIRDSAMARRKTSGLAKAAEPVRNASA
jgi:hypothetical protein